MSMFGMTVFRRPQDGYVRFDFKWYGFGYAPQWDGAYRVWINSYKSAPIRLRWVHLAGWTYSRAYQSRRFVRLQFDGSFAEPYRGWRLHVGKFFIGGDSPKWAIEAKHRQVERYWREMPEPPEEGFGQ